MFSLAIESRSIYECALRCHASLTVCQVLCAKAVGATSSVGFLVLGFVWTPQYGTGDELSYTVEFRGNTPVESEVGVQSLQKLK